MEGETWVMIEQRPFEMFLFSTAASANVVVIIFVNAEAGEVRKDLLVRPEVHFPRHDFPELTIGPR